MIAHLSDLHLLAGGRALGGVADTVGALRQAAVQLRRLGSRLDAVVVSGDVADLGEADAYRIAADVLRPVAEDAGAELVWTIGNHDERGAFRRVLFEADSGGDDPAPVDHVVRCGDLRIASIDSTVPGWHHGRIDARSLDWLRGVLAEPAPAGTLLSLHHAPIASPVVLMELLELQGADDLADVIRGTDVRAVLGGHLHYPTAGAFAGVPVFVAGALAYAIDASAPPRDLVGVDGGRSFNLVHCFDDGSVVTSTVPLGPFPEVARFDEGFLASLERLPPAERLERFSRKAPQS